MGSMLQNLHKKNKKDKLNILIMIAKIKITVITENMTILKINFRIIIIKTKITKQEKTENILQINLIIIIIRVLQIMRFSINRDSLEFADCRKRVKQPKLKKI